MVKLALVLLLGLGTGLRAEPPAGAEALGDAGHYLRAKALLDPYVAAHPEDAEALYLLSQAEGALGNLETSLKDAENALKSAENALTRDGANAKYHAQIAAACGRLAQSAGLLKQLGYARRVKKELDTALELDANCPHALYGLALFYYAAPSLLGGDKQKAQDAAEKLTKLKPVWGYLTQAKLAGERKDAAAEEGFYKKALEADPQSYEAMVKMANFYLTHDLSAAKRLAQDAIALDPGQAEAWKVLAQAQVATQCWDELRADLERAHQAVPDDLAPYYSSALALEQSGHFLDWSADFLKLYMSAAPEGNEPTLAEAEKSQKRVQSIAMRASLQ